MSFELSGGKRRKTFDLNVCILCNGDFGKHLVSKPREESRQVILNSADRRKNEAANRISSLRDTEKLLFKWHRECYMTYTSEVNVQRYEKKN